MSKIGNMTYLNSTAGISEIIRGSFTLQPGISPSSATLVTMPLGSALPATGILTISFLEDTGLSAPDDVTLTFPECAVNQATLRKQGPYLWSIQILDRRWKWRFGEISGEYNKRERDGTLITSSEKTPQELAVLCLTAMGEQDVGDPGGPIVTLLPNDSRPHVKWDVSNPARELANLTEDLGCLVCLQLDDSVKLFPIETGTPPPAGDRSESGESIVYRLTPSRVKLIGQATEFQSRLVIEAVGLDLDDEVKLMADLSYLPLDNATDPISFADVATSFGEPARVLSARTCFRWYRIKEQLGGGLEVPGGEQTLLAADQIHLLAGMVQEETVSGATKQRKKPLVYGSFYSEDVDQLDIDGQYQGNFTIDTQRNLVIFSHPMFRASVGIRKVALLVLECGYTVTGNNGSPIRYTRLRTVPNATVDSQPFTFRSDQVKQTILVNYDDSIPGNEISETNNEADQDTEADYYIDAELAKYAIATNSDHAQYLGIVAIDLDGIVKTIQWVVGGGTPSLTMASSDDRANPFLPNYDEKRAREKQKRINEDFSLTLEELNNLIASLSADVDA